MNEHKASQQANESLAGEPVASNGQASGAFACRSNGAGQQGSTQAPTEDFLRASSDEDALDYLFDYARYLIRRERPRPWEDIVPSFPVGLRTVYMVALVQWEVENGGFEQLFWNNGVQIAPYAAEALERIGFREAARIVLAAKQLHEAEMASNPEYASQEYPGSYDFEDMHSLSLQFCVAADAADVYDRLVEYIRANTASCVSSEG